MNSYYARQWERFVQSFERFNWQDYLIPVAIFIIFLVFRKVFTKYIFKLILRLAKKSKTDVLTNLLLSFEKPLRAFWIILGTYLALMALPFPVTAVAFVDHLYRSLLILLLGWGFFNYTGAHSTIFLTIAKWMDLDENSMVIPFLSKMLRFIVVALTILIILAEWEFKIGGFIAGLGLGGLAFALAAQDTIGNFFGGVIIVTEKPFSKGDWIQTPTVEGVVEDITFRSTRVRTFADSVVTVPNSTLASEPITNWSQMRKRRITFNLGLEYATTKEQLQSVRTKIEAYLRQHDQVDQEVIMVHFSEFNSSSLDIFIYFFTNTIVWSEWYVVKEEINLKIIEILEEEGVSVAFPSRSVYMKRESEDEILPPQER
ncbi:mechanosensitive ion channel family protein [Halalkalibacterium halodurans]|uniref:mechanosensitive ion channel family protein n=1 Tax=Halalkalibacterium halodurans TaxID=86665 RepID=UPI00106765E8|nr:mechanosensitive ion channel family protein [Halalkalibacterium halodurans]TES55847.1 mechanosensitive ion channel family protein [Halalkalibacterium halodurans]